MRDQYAGDLSDLFKFSLLRALAADDRRLGIGWYYAPGHDGRSDGKHIEHWTEDGWRVLDPEVHRALAGLTVRSVQALEALPIWPHGTVFHREPIDRHHRDAWVRGMQAALDPADLVFLDPDNGIGKEATKHARLGDIQALQRPARALVLIKFPHHSTKHDIQIEALHGQLRGIGFSNVLTLATTASVPVRPGAAQRIPRSRFFTLVGADPNLSARMRAVSDRIRMTGTAQASVRGDGA